ncbi:MAG: tRNA uridine-5-carboxymethylaminomethyl(34) synthesis GTPase MnmE [Fusobacteria bacterium]|nr:tRNA uridine-5-carboxymethylaminomethyl(34) synthesis GTPase MnmE [Fusobacteriota bacterium]
MIENKTIANIITPPGKSGVGIIRVSGEQSFMIIDQLFKPYDQQSFMAKESHKAYLGKVVRSNGSLLDEALVLLFKGPNSFTGDDTVEIQAHGNPFILREILKEILLLGARQSQAGEFSRQAFLNGKLDLTQCEGILDTINASNKLALQQSLSQLEGSLRKKIKNISKELIKLSAYLEATIDFPDDEIDSSLSRTEIAVKADNIRKTTDNLLKTYQQGKLIKEGITTVLIGQPNAGKSSLLNCFLNEDRAIITELPGTTRDAIEEQIILDELTLKLVDTAGFRETEDKIEKIGIAKTYDYIQIAQLVIFLIDASKGLTTSDQKMLDHLDRLEKKYLLVYNKADLLSQEILENNVDRICISAKHSTGLEILMSRIKEIFLEKESEELYLNNLRYYESLNKVRTSIETFIRELSREDIPYDLLTIHLKEAYQELSFITGENFTDELLENIFNQFCIGK